MLVVNKINVLNVYLDCILIKINYALAVNWKMPFLLKTLRIVFNAFKLVKNAMEKVTKIALYVRINYINGPIIHAKNAQILIISSNLRLKCA